MPWGEGERTGGLFPGEWGGEKKGGGGGGSAIDGALADSVQGSVGKGKVARKVRAKNEKLSKRMKRKNYHVSFAFAFAFAFPYPFPFPFPWRKEWKQSPCSLPSSASTSFMSVYDKYLVTYTYLPT